MNGSSSLPSWSDLSRTLTPAKRDTLAAELESDPQLSTAKRQQRNAAFNSTVKQASLERQVATLTATKHDLQTKLREKDLAIERLEKDRRVLYERQTKLEDEKARGDEDHDAQKTKDDAEIRSLRSALHNLREQHEDLQDEFSNLKRTTAQSSATDRAEINKLTGAASLLENELAQATSLANERNAAIEALQEANDELMAENDALIRHGSNDDSITVSDELHRQTAYFKSVEDTNLKLTSQLAALRDRHASIEVLREEKRGLEHKLRSLEPLRARVAELEAKLEAARLERQEWTDKAAKTPASLTKDLSDLRLKHALLLEEHGVTKAALKHRETEYKALETHHAELEGTIESHEGDMRQLKELTTTLIEQRKFADKEISFLKEMVASDVQVAAQEGFSSDSSQAERIQQLETLLEAYKASNVKLTKDLADLTTAATSSSKGRKEEIEVEREVTAQVQDALAEAKQESQQHLDRIEELEQKLFELQGEIAGGRHVPPGVRVLSLRDNPTQQWVDIRQAAMDRLRGENDALLKRLKELDERGATPASGNVDGSHSVPVESFELLKQEKLELEDVIKQKEKRLLRLKQVFNDKGLEFKDALASILGFKIAFYSSGQIRVTSTFDLNASFVFQPNRSADGGNFQLVAQAEGASEDIPNMMQYWIGTEQCIPGFMASVSLECYERSKQTQ